MPVESLYADPVAAEIHEVRRRLLEASGGNVVKFRQRLRERQSASGRRIVSGAVKKHTEPSDAMDSPAAS
jgi:predicted ATP-dependent Lon-type protease